MSLCGCRPTLWLIAGVYPSRPRCWSRSRTSSTGSTPTGPIFSRRELACLVFRQADGSIGDSDDELERFLAVLRFSFSKELKFVRARLGKPYNSALGELRRSHLASQLTAGEHFRCSWRLPPLLIDKQTKEPIVRTHVHVPLAGEPAYGGQGGSGWTTPVLRAQDGGKTPSETSSLRSVQSTTSKKQAGSSSFRTKNKSTETLPGTVNRAIPGPGEEIESDPDAGVVDSEKVSVVFLVRWRKCREKYARMVR